MKNDSRCQRLILRGRPLLWVDVRKKEKRNCLRYTQHCLVLICSIPTERDNKVGNSAMDIEIIGTPNILPNLYKDLGGHINKALADVGAHNYT